MGSGDLFPLVVAAAAVLSTAGLAGKGTQPAPSMREQGPAELGGCGVTKPVIPHFFRILKLS